jgi:hypothetical protein
MGFSTISAPSRFDGHHPKTNALKNSPRHIVIESYYAVEDVSKSRALNVIASPTKQHFAKATPAAFGIDHDTDFRASVRSSIEPKSPDRSPSA